MASLNDLLRSPELGLTLIQAGGPEREISWVASGELHSILPILTQDALVIVRGDDPSSSSTWRDVVGRLSRTQIAGLSYHLAVGETTPPNDLVQATSDYRLPLCSIPASTPVAQLSRVLAMIRHGDELRQARESLLAQRRVLDLAFEGSGPAGIVSALASLTGRHIAIVREDGSLGAATAGYRPDSSSTSVNRQVQRLSIGSGQELVAQGEPLSPEGIAAFTAAAMVLSVEARSLSHNTVLERERWGRVTRAVLTGHGDAASLCALLDPTQTLPDSGHVVVVQGAAETIARWRAEHRAGGQRFITRYPIDDHRSTEIAPGIGVAWQVVSAPELDKALTSITSHGLDAAVGIHTPLTEAPMSRLSAEALLPRLSPTEQLYRTPRTPLVLHADTHSGMLSHMLTQPETQSFAAMVLGPLSRAATGGDQDLRDTLRAFLEHHGQRGPTAAALSIHRNTLRGRILSIETLLGRSLDSPDDRAELWVALRAE